MLYLFNSKIMCTFAPSNFKYTNTMENKTTFQTITVCDGGKMLKSEPVECCGLTEYWMVAQFRGALLSMMEHYTADLMEEGCTVAAARDVYCAFEVLENVTQYQQDYLKRRVETLEAALGLVHNGDIDQYATETNEGNRE